MPPKYCFVIALRRKWHWRSAPLGTLVRSIPSLSWERRCNITLLCSSTDWFSGSSPTQYASSSVTSSVWPKRTIAFKLLRIKFAVLAKSLRTIRIDTEVNNVPLDGSFYNRRFLYSLLHIHQLLDCSLGPHPLPRQVSRFVLASSSLAIRSARSTVE